MCNVSLLTLNCNCTNPPPPIKTSETSYRQGNETRRVNNLGKTDREAGEEDRDRKKEIDLKKERQRMRNRMYN